jgi:hypothetical protein
MGKLPFITPISHQPRIMPSTPEQLLTQLTELPDYPYPKALIEEMIQRQQEMTPALLAVLEDASQYPQNYTDDARWKTLTFATYLLAQFRETRAFKPLCDTLGHQAEITDELWGDTLTQDMGCILASLYDGDDAPLRDLMRNREANEFVRGDAVPKAYMCLLKVEKISRAELEAYSEELLSTGLEREPSFAWDGWTALCSDLGFARLVPLIKKAFEDDLCDPFFYGLDNMLRSAESGGDEACMRDMSLINDTIEETCWWHCWSEPETPKSHPAMLFEPRTEPKIGRNHPCPCASGKKYKKCCGATA